MSKKEAHSNPGDLVLDPFCGCGTTIDAAEKNSRDWIGIDVTQLAISLIKNRLQDTYGSRLKFVSGSAQGRAGSPLPAAERGEGSESSDGAHGVTRPTVSVVRITSSNGGRSVSSARGPSSRKKARTTALRQDFFPRRPEVHQAGANHHSSQRR